MIVVTSNGRKYPININIEDGIPEYLKGDYPGTDFKIEIVPKDIHSWVAPNQFLDYSLDGFVRKVKIVDREVSFIGEPIPLLLPKK